MHRVELLGGVVEDHHVAVEPEAQVRQVPVVLGGVFKRELVEVLVADGVVAHVPDPAAGEALGEAVGAARVPSLRDFVGDGDRVRLVGARAFALEVVEDGHVVLLGHHLEAGAGVE